MSIRSPGHPPSAPPIIGRETALGQIEEALADVEAGEQVCLSVEGEPGIGKTRLLAELEDRGDERGYVVLTGCATEFEREQPFGAWVDALGAYTASQEHRLREAWDAEAIGELTGILPGLRSRRGAATRTVTDERYRAHRAMRGLLELLSEERPLVLVLDDLHWADEASLALLSALLRRPARARLLIALAFRPAQAPRHLAAALTIPALRRIVLERLSEEQSTLLLGNLDARAAAAIYRQGGGNPFYLQQLSAWVAAPRRWTRRPAHRRSEASCLRPWPPRSSRSSSRSCPPSGHC